MLRQIAWGIKMSYTEKKVRSINRYEGVIISVRVDQAELMNGALTMREVVEHPGGVAVVAVDGQGQVYCVEQYRYPMGRALLEIPAGKLEPGEDPAVCAVRELSEETGLTAGRLEPMGKIFTSPGFSDETLYLFLATELKQGSAHPDPNEFLHVRRMALQTLVDRIMDGSVSDGKTVAGVLKAARLLEDRA